MRRAELLRKLQKVLSVHGRVFKSAIRFRKLLLRNGEIFKHFVRETLRPLPVKTLNERHPFLARNFAVPYFLRGVVGCPADSEFDKRGVVMEVVNTVVYGVVLAVGAGGALRAGLKPSMLGGIVKRLLRAPFHVIT